jgi:peptidoglycan/LPS O-acetylase OafA/YrhL
MMISISNPVGATYIIIVLLAAAILIWMRRSEASGFFPLAATEELKGLAILAIIFSHIGYFLISEHSFLFPLSIMAGVGVDLFLFLSGYGLTVSAIKKKLGISQFYIKRLIKLFVPFWLILIIFFSLDYFVLHLAYGSAYLVRSFLGIFPRADLYNDVNSPLWYFSLILFYYLIYPFVFLLKNHRLSALVVYLISYLIVWLNFDFLSPVRHLHEVHLMAFPLGMLLASLYYEPSYFREVTEKIFIRFKAFKRVGYWLFIIFLLAVIGYSSYHSNVGTSQYKQELTSLLTMSAIIILFLIKKVNFGFFYIFGVFSYEIYLLHWPLLYRYDIFYKFTPAWLATILYLILFLVLAWLLKKCSEIILKLVNNK